MTWTRPPHKRKPRALSTNRRPCQVCGRMFAVCQSSKRLDQACSTTCLAVLHSRKPKDQHAQA